MNERLKQIRKTLSLSQEAFGSKLGVTGPGISKIESGDRNLTEQMTRAVIREFNVNEHWFRTGEGEMFNPLSREDEFMKAAKELQIDGEAEIMQLLIEYWKMTPDQRKIVKKFLSSISEVYKKDTSSEIYNGKIPSDPEELEKLYPPVEIETKDVG